MDKAERKEREFNLRRAEILEQAEKIFAAKGFHNTTVAEIAGASGFAVGTLYQFFESKEQLYTLMLTEKLNMMYSGVRESVAIEADTIRKIERLVASQFRIIFLSPKEARRFGNGWWPITPSTSPSRKR
jgi:AcrR family transcriptional regulator